MLKPIMKNLRASLSIAALALGVAVLPAQGIEPYCLVALGPAATKQEALPPLPLFQLKTDIGLMVPLGTIGLMAEAGWHYLSPSAYSDTWLRYRGLQGAHLGAGVFYTLPRSLPWCAAGSPARISLVGGSMASRYLESYSYLFSPYAALSADTMIRRLGNRLAIGAGISIPCVFRADCLSFGFEASVSLRLIDSRDMKKGNTR